MGALTLKNFPFELRKWDIEKFLYINPTDSFGCNINVYVSKNQIIQVESSYNNINKWLSDKAWQFFDSVFWNVKTMKTKTFFNLLGKIVKIIYIFDHCNKHKNKFNFFTIVCDYVSLEILNSLILIFQNYSFVKLWKVENVKMLTNFEINFQLNSTKLNNSTLALFISTNSRYEGYFLNLLLWQWIFKGDFKCFSIGSLVNLTFPVLVLGSNFSVIKTIACGNNLVCQDLKQSINPFLIYNYELLKWNSNINTFLKILNNVFVFSKIWNGLNFLSASLSHGNLFSLIQLYTFSLKDLNHFSILYFTHLTSSSISNLKRVTELKLLKFKLHYNQFNINKKIFVDQNYKVNQNHNFSNKIFSSYLYLPNNTMFENSETFINTEGYIKRTTKFITIKNTKSSWQILKKVLKLLKKNLYFFLTSKNKSVMFNFKKMYDFKNFINLHFYPIKTLTSLSFYKTVKNKSIKLYYKHILNFKLKETKQINSKFKYWLDNFFSDSQDEYSRNSIVLNKCSKIFKIGLTNFF